jgi:hypothetical protein
MIIGIQSYKRWAYMYLDFRATLEVGKGQDTADRPPSRTLLEHRYTYFLIDLRSTTFHVVGYLTHMPNNFRCLVPWCSNDMIGQLATNRSTPSPSE